MMDFVFFEREAGALNGRTRALRKRSARVPWSRGWLCGRRATSSARQVAMPGWVRNARSPGRRSQNLASTTAPHLTGD